MNLPASRREIRSLSYGLDVDAKDGDHLDTLLVRSLLTPLYQNVLIMALTNQSLIPRMLHVCYFRGDPPDAFCSFAVRNVAGDFNGRKCFHGDMMARAAARDISSQHLTSSRSTRPPLRRDSGIRFPAGIYPASPPCRPSLKPESLRLACPSLAHHQARVSG